MCAIMSGLCLQIFLSVATGLFRNNENEDLQSTLESFRFEAQERVQLCALGTGMGSGISFQLIQAISDSGFSLLDRRRQSIFHLSPNACPTSSLLRLDGCRSKPDASWSKLAPVGQTTETWHMLRPKQQQAAAYNARVVI